MRLPADPATDVPRLARVTAPVPGARLPSASAAEVGGAHGSTSRSRLARASTSPQLASSSSSPHMPTVAARAALEPSAHTQQSALSQQQRTAQSPSRSTPKADSGPDLKSSMAAVDESSSPIIRELMSQDGSRDGQQAHDSLDGYILQV